MKTPIFTPTPHLDEKESERFLAMVEDGLKHPVGPVPTPKLDGALKQILFASKLLNNLEDLDPSYARIVSKKFWDMQS